MAPRPLKILSVCSGIGGIDLGIRYGSLPVRTVCYVEREAFCASVLVARMEEQGLDEAAIWDCLTTFPALAFRGKVDGLIGGIPCPPYSRAGKGLGADDERDLWSTVLRILRELGCWFVFIENVAGFRSHRDGIGRALSDLAEIGWDAEWVSVSCEQLGAKHRRERLFLLAYSPSTRLEGTTGEEHQFYVGSSFRNKTMANTRLQFGREDSTPGHDRNRDDSRWVQSSNRSKSLFETMAHPCSQRLEEPGPSRFSEEHTLPFGAGNFFGPGREPHRWSSVPLQFHIAKPTVRGSSFDGLPSWVVESNMFCKDRVRALGNSCSPLAAYAAWEELWGRVLSRFATGE